MKKISTLFAIAAMALTASAQTSEKVTISEEDVATGTLAAETVLVDNNTLKVTTVWAANAGSNDAEFAQGTLSNWFEVRVKNNPSAEFPNGEQNGAQTPVIFVTKEDTSIEIFYRTGPGKKIIMTNKADYTEVEGSVNEIPDPTSEKNNLMVWSYSLKANNEYVLTQKGGTGRFYGFTYTGSSSAITDITVDENAPVEYFNLQGIRVDNPENGLYIKRQGNTVTKVLVK